MYLEKHLSTFFCIGLHFAIIRYQKLCFEILDPTDCPTTYPVHCLFECDQKIRYRASFFTSEVDKVSNFHSSCNLHSQNSFFRGNTNRSVPKCYAQNIQKFLCEKLLIKSIFLKKGARKCLLHEIVRKLAHVKM